MAKLFLRTFGCQMNEYDSEKIADVLRAAQGVERSERPEDADIIVFDPDTVIDKATYANPRQPAQGMRHVIVSGVPLIRDGKLDTTVMPGQPVRGPVGRLPIQSRTSGRAITEMDIMTAVQDLRASVGRQ